MRKAIIVLVGVLVVGLAGVAWAGTRPAGVEVIDCGINAHGAYAKVRVDNLLGFRAQDQRVGVDFSMEGSQWRHDDRFGGSVVRVSVPAHGRRTAVVQGHFPPHGSFQAGTHMDLKVKGRTVYRLGDGFTGRFVTKKFVMTHPAPAIQNHVYIETVPDDPTALRCTPFRVSEEQNDD